MEKLLSVIEYARKYQEIHILASKHFLQVFEKGLIELIRNNPLTKSIDSDCYVMDTSSYFSFRYNGCFYNEIMIEKDHIRLANNTTPAAFVPSQYQDEYSSNQAFTTRLSHEGIINLANDLEPLFFAQKNEYEQLIYESHETARKSHEEQQSLSLLDLDDMLFESLQELFETKIKNLPELILKYNHIALNLPQNTAIRFRGKYHNSIIFDVQNSQMLLGYQTNRNRDLNLLKSDSYTSDFCENNHELDIMTFKHKVPFETYLTDNQSDLINAVSSLYNILKLNVIESYDFENKPREKTTNQ